MGNHAHATTNDAVEMYRSKVLGPLRPIAAPAAEHKANTVRALPIGSPPGSGTSKNEPPETNAKIDPVAIVTRKRILRLNMITTTSVGEETYRPPTLQRTLLQWQGSTDSALDRVPVVGGGVPLLDILRVVSGTPDGIQIGLHNGLHGDSHGSIAFVTLGCSPKSNDDERNRHSPWTAFVHV